MPRPEALSVDELLRHHDWVRRVARSLARDESSADDMAQDAWVAALRAPPRDDAPRAWFATVLRHLAERGTRTATRRARREQVAARTELRRSTVETVARAEAHELVVRALMSLSDPGRTTLLLRFFDGLPPREIARRMEVPVETVRSRVRRSLQELRERLGKPDDEDAWRTAILPLLASSRPKPPARVRDRGGAVAAVAVVVAVVAVWLLATRTAGAPARPAPRETAVAAPAPRTVRSTPPKEVAVVPAAAPPAASPVVAAKPVVDAKPGRDGVVLRDGVPVADARVIARRLRFDDVSPADVDGTAYALARKSALWRGGALPGRLDADGVATTTDAQGRFHLELGDGRWFVRATVARAASTWVRAEELGAAARPFVLEPVGSLFGYVTDENGRPMQGVSVVVAGPDEFKAKSNAEGMYYFDRLARGQYGVVSLPTEPLRMWVITSSFIDAGALSRCDIGFDGKGRRFVRGTVRVRGRLARGARIDAMSGGQLFWTGKTEDDGRYECPAVEGEEIEMAVCADDGAGAVADLRRFRVGGVGVDFDLGDGRFGGCVLDEHGKPVPGAQVVMLRAAEGASPSARTWDRRFRARGATTDGGRFQLAASAGPGFVLGVVAPGFAPHETPVEADGAVVRLRRGREVVVHVVDEAGAPAAGASVFTADGWWTPTIADADGLARLRAPDDPAAVFVHDADHGAQSFALAAGAARVEARLVATCSLKVQATEDGKPVVGARVVVLDEAGRPIPLGPLPWNRHGPTETTSVGGGLVRRVSPGRRTVVATLADGRELRAGAELPPGGAVNVLLGDR